MPIQTQFECFLMELGLLEPKKNNFSHNIMIGPILGLLWCIGSRKMSTIGIFDDPGTP